MSTNSRLQEDRPTDADRFGPLGFGGAGIGNLASTVSDADAQAAVATALELGIRYFDTAPHYGLGLSERRLGQALAGVDRTSVLVSTKVGVLLEPNARQTGADLAGGGFDVADTLTRVRDYSAGGVRRSLYESLDRLGLDYVDIAYLHDPEHDLRTAFSDGLAELLRLRDEGLVRQVGVGTNFVATASRILTPADPLAGEIDVLMLAGRWTLLDRDGGEVMARCARRGITVIAAAPFNSGVLADPFPSASGSYNYKAVPPEILVRARRIAAAADSVEVSLPHAALRFPLLSQIARCVVVGMRNPNEVRQNVVWMEDDIPAESWAAILTAAESP